MSEVPTKPHTMDRPTLRERERLSRSRRAANLERMRQTRDALECAVLVVRTLDEAAWERRFGVDAIRMRGILKFSAEAARLRNEQAQLRRLLREHELSVDVTAAMVKHLTSCDWHVKVKRLRELAKQHFLPWTLEAYRDEMDKALKEVHAFKWSTDVESTGMSFFGWRDLRRVDSARGIFQCEFYKTFRGFEIMDYVNTMWDAWTHGETFRHIVIGHRVPVDHEVMQQLGPNFTITRAAEKYPNMEGCVHIVNLVFRVKTATGFTQCVRSVCCPELMRSLGDENDVWPLNLIWFHWDELENDSKGYKFRIGARLRGYDANYVNQWMVEAFGFVLRSERLATKREWLCGGATG